MKLKRSHIFHHGGLKLGHLVVAVVAVTNDKDHFSLLFSLASLDGSLDFFASFVYK
jgi:hypothetical protein